MRYPMLVCSILALATTLAPCAMAQPRPAWIVQPEWVAADEAALADDTLRGRGSATPDEAAAGAWVAGRFKALGLTPAPGAKGFFQTATVMTPRLKGAPALTVDGVAIPGAELFIGSIDSPHGKAVVFTGSDALAIPTADVVIADSRVSPVSFYASGMANHVKLLIVRGNPLMHGMYVAQGGPDVGRYLPGQTLQRMSLVTLPDDAFDKLAAQGAGREVALVMPPIDNAPGVTTNVIGYLPGTDPKAGVVMISAHVDHLGVRPNGTIMHGANDDASGMAAVVELARALAAGPRARRGFLFVGFGSEELGELGSRYFAAHPVMPLASIVTDIEFEMIGNPDPKAAKGAMLMTGFDRSDLGPALQQHGGAVADDPYPAQQLFTRSDNYPLAQAGLVSHTLAGWVSPPTYHQPSDTIANLDMAFMSNAIQSMVEPLRWLANSRFRPAWKAGGRPPA